MMMVIERITAQLPVWMRGFRLADVSAKEIRADEIALERRERELEAALDEEQERIDAVTRETVASGRKSAARQATRRILASRDRMKVHEAELIQVSKQLGALGRIRRLVEAKEQLAASGVLRRLQGMPSAALGRIVSGQVARNELEDQGLSQIADILELPCGAEGTEGDEERELRLALEAAIDAKDPVGGAQAARRITDRPAEGAGL